MTIEKLDTIDIISLEDEGKTVVLLITDHLEWDHVRKHLKQIESKIHTYQDFFESGQVNEHFGDDIVRSIKIELHMLYPYPDACRVFLERGRDLLAAQGVIFTWRHAPSALAADTQKRN